MPRDLKKTEKTEPLAVFYYVEDGNKAIIVEDQDRNLDTIAKSL